MGARNKEPRPEQVHLPLPALCGSRLLHGGHAWRGLGWRCLRRAHPGHHDEGQTCERLPCPDCECFPQCLTSRARAFCPTCTSLSSDWTGVGADGGAGADSVAFPRALEAGRHRRQGVIERRSCVRSHFGRSLPCDLAVGARAPWTPRGARTRHASFGCCRRCAGAAWAGWWSWCSPCAAMAFSHRGIEASGGGSRCAPNAP